MDVLNYIKKNTEVLFINLSVPILLDGSNLILKKDVESIILVCF